MDPLQAPARAATSSFDPHLPPISMLCVDVLRAIMSLDRGTSYTLCPGSTYPQLRLAHVCREWRRAALSTHSLWSRLTVNFRGNEDSPNGKTKSGWSWRENLHNFLRLSRDGPLDVELLWLHSQVDSEVHAISAALFETSTRWKHASLIYVFTSPANIDHFFKPIRGQLLSLETLDLSFVQLFSEETHQRSTVTVFRDAPRLRNVLVVLKDILIDLPWHQLVQLAALCQDPGDSTMALIARGIAESQHLTQLVLSTRRNPVRGERTVQPVNVITTRHSSITSLILTRQAYRIVDTLILPALTRLTVAYADAIETQSLYATEAQSFHEVRSLILRSACTITSLRIVNFRPHIAGDGLRLCASQLANLVQLQLHTSPTDVYQEDNIRFVCSLLTPPKPSPTGILPMLERLVIHNDLKSRSTTGGCILEDHPISQDTLGLLSAMLNSRRSTLLPSSTIPASVYATACVRQFDRSQEAVMSLVDFNASEGWKGLTNVYQGQMTIYITTSHDILVDGEARVTCGAEIWLGKTKDAHDTVRDLMRVSSLQ